LWHTSRSGQGYAATGPSKYKVGCRPPEKRMRHAAVLPRRSTHTTSAAGLFGPNLLPHSAAGRLRILVCTDCGLTQLFASTLDGRALKNSPDWERFADMRGPLDLADDDKGQA
jgi:hypothetical protein